MGIGVRLAGRAAVRTLEGPAAQPVGNSAPGSVPVSVPVSVSGGSPGSAAGSAQGNYQPGPSGARAAGRVTGQAGGSVAKGLGGFLRPFGRVGGTIWLEVVGVFFLLPVIVFTPVIWRTRMSWFQGPDHRTFLASTIMVAVFLYLGVSSFWRAHRRGA